MTKPRIAQARIRYHKAQHAVENTFEPTREQWNELDTATEEYRAAEAKEQQQEREAQEQRDKQKADEEQARLWRLRNVIIMEVLLRARRESEP